MTSNHHTLIYRFSNHPVSISLQMQNLLQINDLQNYAPNSDEKFGAAETLPLGTNASLALILF